MAQNFINPFKNQASATKSPFVKARRSSNLGNPQMSLFTPEEIAPEFEPVALPTKPRFKHTWRDNNNMPTHFWQAVGMMSEGDEQFCYFEAENEEAAKCKAEKVFAEQRIYPSYIFVYNMD